MLSLNRKETTKFLGDLLRRDKFSGIGKHWASEVSLDYGTKDVKRIDFLQFEPSDQMSISGIEKGVFTCYEVKSCKADFKSGFGQNFIAERNYLVMPMATYKEVINDIPHAVGVLCPIPYGRDKHEEFENPTVLDGDTSKWGLVAIRATYPKPRKRSMTELLFCMLRSGKEFYKETPETDVSAVFSCEAEVSHKNAKIEALMMDNEQLKSDVFNAEMNRELAEQRTVEILKEYAEKLKLHARKMNGSDFSGEFWDKAVLTEDIDAVLTATLKELSDNKTKNE